MADIFGKVKFGDNDFNYYRISPSPIEINFITKDPRILYTSNIPSLGLAFSITSGGLSYVLNPLPVISNLIEVPNPLLTYTINPTSLTAGFSVTEPTLSGFVTSLNPNALTINLALNNNYQNTTIKPTPLTISFGFPSDTIVHKMQYTMQWEQGGPGFLLDDLLYARMQDYDKDGNLVGMFDVKAKVIGNSVEGFNDLELIEGATSWQELEKNRDGIEFVRIGNLTNTARQGSVIITADGIAPDAADLPPYIDVKDQIDSFDDFFYGLPKVRLGRLDGITDPDFGVLSGYGLYGQNIYLKGNILISNPSAIDATDLANALHDANGEIIFSLTPTGAGLFIGATHLGYYDTSAWKTYMDNSGNFYLGGTSGKLQWVSGTNTLTISGSVTIDNPSTFNGGAPLDATDLNNDAGWDGTAATLNSGVSLTGGGITLGTTSRINSGQSAYDTGTGFWLSAGSGTPVFSLGNSAGNKLTWNGTALGIVGAITGSTITGSSFQSIIDADGLRTNINPEGIEIASGSVAASIELAHPSGILTVTGSSDVDFNIAGNVTTSVFSASVGFRQGTMTAGRILMSNGFNFVSTAFPDLSGSYDVAGTASGLMSTHNSTYTHANIANGQTAYGWGNHASAGYITDAYSDLVADSKIGTGATQVAYGNHTHTSVYHPYVSGGTNSTVNIPGNDGLTYSLTFTNGVCTAIDVT